MRKISILLNIIILIVLLNGDQTTLVHPPFKHNMGFNRANSTIARMILGRDVRFHRTGGLFAIKLKSEDDPTTRKDNAILTLFGINNHKIVYNVNTNQLRTFGEKGREDSTAALYYPTDIAATESGIVYLTDTYNYRIVKLRYDSAVDTLAYVGSAGGFGIDSSSFDLPAMLDLDSDENVYITDRGNDRIVVMDSLLRPVKILKNISRPGGIAVIDKEKGYCRVKDEKPFIIAISNGVYILKLSMKGREIARQNASNLPGYSNAGFVHADYDYHGNIWVTDSVNSVVHKFDSDLNYIVTFGSKGYGDKQFYKPLGITIYRKYGQVFIGEKSGFQYYWVGVDGWIESLTPSTITDSTKGLTITLYTTEQCRVKIEIKHQGETVRQLTKYLRRNLGINHIVWDLKNSEGELIEDSGVYDIDIELEPLYSSRGFFVKQIRGRVEKE